MPNKKQKNMKRMLSTALAATASLCLWAQQASRQKLPDTTPKDTTAVKSHGITVGKNSHATAQDTLRLKLNRMKINSNAVKVNSNAVKIKKYDTFNEKMKEPWLGDILKDIIFH